jgi:hypothetical protein
MTNAATPVMTAFAEKIATRDGTAVRVARIIPCRYS